MRNRRGHPTSFRLRLFAIYFRSSVQNTVNQRPRGLPFGWSVLYDEKQQRNQQQQQTDRIRGATIVQVLGRDSEKHNTNSALYTFAVYTGDKCFKPYTNVVQKKI